MSWIPSECESNEVSDTSSPVVECFVPESVRRTAELPWLTFGLSEAMGYPLTLRLGDLLLDSNGRRKYCIVRGPSVYTTPLSRVAFGTMVLSSFYTVFDMKNGYIGLADDINRPDISLME